MKFPNPPRAVLLAAVVSAIGLASLQLSNAATDTTDVPKAGSRAVSASQLAAEQIVVRYKPQADLQAFQDVIEATGARQKDDLRGLRIKVLKVKPADRQRTLERLRADPRVEYAEPDAVGNSEITRPNDTDYSRQWSWPVTLTDLLWDKHKGSDMIVAVIDSGVKADHPDFAGKLMAGYDFVSDDATPNDETGHGSVVSGVVGALSNNNAGVVGGCWNCRVMPLKSIDADGGALASDVAKAIQYAADNGAKIINLSLSGEGAEPVVETAVNYAAGKGAIVVAAAGNQAGDGLRWPAQYEKVISVAATTPVDTLAAYSNFGPTVDIAAPGFARGPDFMSEGYVDKNGTSLSAPTVTAILALLWSAHPNATPNSLRQAVISTADPCCGGKIPGGRINAIKAYNLLAGAQATDTVKPAVSVVSPANNISVSGNAVPITATASDNVGVAKVHLYINGDSPGTDSVAPYSFIWNSVNTPDGPVAISLIAYDAAGNMSAKVDRTFTVNNTTPADTTKPVLSVSGPAQGATINGTVDVTAEASDSSGIAKVDFLIDDALSAIDITAPYTFSWNTAAQTNGPHTYRIRAYDATGNATEITRNVTVQNGGTLINADINGDGKVGITDLSMLLSAWGTADAKADLNKNGKVDITDLSQLLSAWTR